MLPEEEAYALGEVETAGKRLRACADDALSAELHEALPSLIDHLAAPSAKLRKATLPLLTYVSSRLRKTGAALPLEELAQLCAAHADAEHSFSANMALCA